MARGAEFRNAAPQKSGGLRSRTEKEAKAAKQADAEQKFYECATQGMRNAFAVCIPVEVALSLGPTTIVTLLLRVLVVVSVDGHLMDTPFSNASDKLVVLAVILARLLRLFSAHWLVGAFVITADVGRFLALAARLQPLGRRLLYVLSGRDDVAVTITARYNVCSRQSLTSLPSAPEGTL